MNNISLLDGSIYDQARAQHELLPRLWALDNFCQIGIVVENTELACELWGSRLGIETWYRPCQTDFRTSAQGRKLDQSLDIAVGYSGRIQIEILSVSGQDQGIFAPRKDCVPSPNVSTNPDALIIHHLGYYVRDLDSQKRRLIALGAEPAQTGVLRLAANIKTRFAYWDMRHKGGGVVELIEQRISGVRVGMSEWLVRAGSISGHFKRL